MDGWSTKTLINGKIMTFLKSDCLQTELDVFPTICYHIFSLYVYF